MLVAGCLVAGVLQVRAQRKLLRALDEVAPAPTAMSRKHREHLPMTFEHPVLAGRLAEGPLAGVFGMN